LAVRADGRTVFFIICHMIVRGEASISSCSGERKSRKSRKRGEMGAWELGKSALQVTPEAGKMKRKNIGALTLIEKCFEKQNRQSLDTASSDINQSVAELPRSASKTWQSFGIFVHSSVGCLFANKGTKRCSSVASSWCERVSRQQLHPASTAERVTVRSPLLSAPFFQVWLCATYCITRLYVVPDGVDGCAVLEFHAGLTILVFCWHPKEFSLLDGVAGGQHR
jgi:hypothetical protein